MKSIPLSVLMIFGLMTGAAAASDAGLTQGLLNPATIQISQNTPPNEGQVSEALAAGKYTYLHVTKDGKGTWLAIPRREIPVGAKIRYGRGLPMQSFHSRTLNRDFDEVFFLAGVEVVGGASVPGAAQPSIASKPPGHPPTMSPPPGHPPIPGRQPAQMNPANSGQVSEVLDAGQYSYLRVQKDGKGTWLAIPRREISVGDKIRYGNGMAMKSFHSKSLNRDFDVVYFLSGVTVEGK